MCTAAACVLCIYRRNYSDNFERIFINLSVRQAEDRTVY